jgi:hypothetical protein
MFILRCLLGPWLYFQYWCGRFCSKPAQPVFVKELCPDSGNSVKDGLIRHHVRQFHESSCSVASVACVINALLEKTTGRDHHCVTQHELLEKVRAAHWKERMSDKGYKGRRGLPLDTLGQVVKASLAAYEIPHRFVEIVQAGNSAERPKSFQHRLRSRLVRFETREDCIIIAHFDQGSFVPELHIPHISPVGGFDQSSGQVLVLDVDSSQPYPYKIDFSTFCTGLAFSHNFLFRRFGYGSGGYIFIRL